MGEVWFSLGNLKAFVLAALALIYHRSFQRAHCFGASRYHQQASQGDNATERPMWAEKGGLDFEGRARWDAWAAVKVMRGCWMDGFWMNLPCL